MAFQCARLHPLLLLCFVLLLISSRAGSQYTDTDAYGNDYGTPYMTIDGSGNVQTYYTYGTPYTATDAYGNTITSYSTNHDYTPSTTTYYSQTYSHSRIYHSATETDSVPSSGTRTPVPNSEDPSTIKVVPWYETTAGKWGIGLGGGGGCACMLGTVGWCIRKRRRQAYSKIDRKLFMAGNMEGNAGPTGYEGYRHQQTVQQQQPFLYDPQQARQQIPVPMQRHQAPSVV